MPIGRSRQEESQRTLLKAKIKPGCVLHVFCDFTTPPKNKFLVIIHADYDDDLLLAFLINSEIHPLIQKQPAMAICQIKLERSTYPEFLRHDSFLNCADVKDELDVDTVLDHLLENPNDFRDFLNESEILKICEVVKNAETITGYDKELILGSLGK